MPELPECQVSSSLAWAWKVLNLPSPTSCVATVDCRSFQLDLTQLNWAVSLRVSYVCHKNSKVCTCVSSTFFFSFPFPLSLSTRVSFNFVISTGSPCVVLCCVSFTRVISSHSRHPWDGYLCPEWRLSSSVKENAHETWMLLKDSCTRADAGTPLYPSNGEREAVARVMKLRYCITKYIHVNGRFHLMLSHTRDISYDERCEMSHASVQRISLHTHKHTHTLSSQTCITITLLVA